MTVVIMALCHELKGSVLDRSPQFDSWIVAACDKQLSTDDVTAEAEIWKVQKVHPGGSWLLGYSGEPAHFDPIWDHLRRRTDQNMTGSADMISAAARAYAAHRLEVIEQYYLANYELTMKTFLARGLKLFGQTEFARILGRIESFDLGITLMLGGCSPLGRAMTLATISNPGVPYIERLAGFVSIGEGAEVALGQLRSGYKTIAPMTEALYRVLEAKLASETTRSVGPSTVLLAMGKDGTTTLVENYVCENFRALWDTRRKEIPHDVAVVLANRNVREW